MLKVINKLNKLDQRYTSIIKISNNFIIVSLLENII